MLGGDEWQEEIFSTHLPTSDLLLYLLTADSLASENCYKEFKIAREKKIRVIPIIYADCDWENDQLSDLQGFPDNFKPINEWTPESKGWKNVVTGIRKTITDMQSQADPDSGISEGELRAEIIFQHGNILMMFGQVDMAIEAYSDAIDLNPRCAPAYNNRGAAYLGKDEFDRSIEDCNSAIALKFNYAEAYNNRGAAYGAMGKFDQSIKDCTKAIQFKSEYASAFSNRGNAYQAQGNFENAIEDYDKAIQLEPYDPGQYSNRGTTYARKGEYEKAIEDFTKAIGLNPDYAEAYNNRGEAHREKGELDAALSDLNKAIRLKANNASSRSMLSLR